MTNSSVGPNAEDPLAVLRASHVQIGRRCALLARLVEHLGENGCDDAARRTATHLRNYFDEAAIIHHEDEELDLFPALLGDLPAAESAAAERLAASLSREHVELHDIYDQLRPGLVAVAAGLTTELDPTLCDRLQTLYLTHVEREEIELMPLVERYLTPASVQRIGPAMAARRKAPPPRAVEP